MSKANPRYANGNARRKRRAWLRAQARPCWICVAFGRRGGIDYSLPARHPFSFEMDELDPVALGGDPLDPANLDAAHRCCNEWRGSKTVEQVLAIAAAQAAGMQAGTPKNPLDRRSEGTTSRDW